MWKIAKKLIFISSLFLCLFDAFDAIGADTFSVFNPGEVSSTNMCTQSYLGVDGTGDPSVAVAALWCSWSGGENNTIAVEHGTCTFSSATVGTCSYTTNCDEGWYITDTNDISKEYTSKPNKTTAGTDECRACTTGRPYTITYSAGAGTGTAGTQTVTYYGTFTTKKVDSTDLNFTKANATFQQWECSGTGCGGSSSAFATAGTSYTYNKGAGDATLTAIWKCNAGYYLPTDSTTCTDVDDGYYSPANDNTRYSCPEKTKSIYVKSDSLASSTAGCYVVTEAGKYIATANDGVQTTCPAGLYCSGEINIHYGTAGGTETCPAGAFCAEGVSNYTACVAGSYQDASGQSECEACQNGKTTPVLSGNLLGRVGATECSVDCANNTNVASWTNNAEWTPENKVNNLCTALTCSAGSYFKIATEIATATATETSNLCALCPIGSYNDTVTGASENGTDGQCKVCSAGLRTDGTGSESSTACTATCENATDVTVWATTSWDTTNENVKNLCTVAQCDAGAFLVGNSSGTYWQKQCKPCGTGKYCTGGTANYKQCPIGSYQDTPHQSVCKTCAKGKTTANTGSTASSACSVNCPSISHLKTWEQPTWNDTSHTVDNLCAVATCEVLGATTTVSEYNGVPAPDKKSCVYTGTCARGYNDESATCSGEDCICSANTININWDENYGNPIDDSSCTYGQTISFPQSNGRAGYEFNGWMIQQ